jgi:small subunit ribosomal protein S28e
MPDDGIPAQVVEIVAKTGVYGEIMQVMAKVLDGRDKGRIIRRNVKGPVKVGDLLMLLDTDTEAKPIRAR